jgi:hypothetical protein
METGALLAAAAIIAILALAAAWRARRGKEASPFCSGPYNIGVYDSPYTNYPVYDGRASVRWDVDGRCAAYCSQLPCAVWCR